MSVLGYKTKLNKIYFLLELHQLFFVCKMICKPQHSFIRDKHHHVHRKGTDAVQTQAFEQHFEPLLSDAFSRTVDEAFVLMLSRLIHLHPRLEDIQGSSQAPGQHSSRAPREQHNQETRFVFPSWCEPVTERRVCQEIYCRRGAIPAQQCRAAFVETPKAFLLGNHLQAVQRPSILRLGKRLGGCD